MKRKRVAVVYKSLPQYRRRFFELLRDELATREVDFQLIYGQGDAADESRLDRSDLPWAVRISNRIFRVGGVSLYWQPCFQALRGADLVIVEQASKLLVNYVLLAQHILGMRQLAFWGHGKNFQANTASRSGEIIKRMVSRRVGWWFTYNRTSSEVVEELGFPADRITDVQNAIDTEELVRWKGELRDADLAALRATLGIQGDDVCIFVGSLYPEKRIGFLLDAAERIRAALPSFELIVSGAGPDASLVMAAATRHPWIHYVGPQFDQAKVPYFGLSRLFLLPGVVGLAVLDSFALDTPLVTTAVEGHGPEIEYLCDGYNGVILENTGDPDAYASAVVNLLKDETRLSELIAGCRKSASEYTIEAMVERFAEGVLNALAR